MRLRAFFLSSFLLALGALALLKLASPLIPKAAKDQTASYGKLPLSFELNEGQTDPQVKFLSRGPGYSLFFTAADAVLALRTVNGEASRTQQKNSKAVPVRVYVDVPGVKVTEGSSQAVLRIRLLGANPVSEIAGEEELPGKSNYFFGNDPSRWKTNVPHYAKVRYRNIYPGMDLVYYGAPGKSGQLEYDFVVSPGADPNKIGLAFEGAVRLELDPKGDLVLHLGQHRTRVSNLLAPSRVEGRDQRAADEVLRFRTPTTYQEINGTRHLIPCRYVVRGSERGPQSPAPNVEPQTVGFELGPYDQSRPVVIDPALVYSTYLGGNGNNFGGSASAIAVDSAGNAYVTGTTDAANFPITPGAFQTTLFAGGVCALGGGCRNAFVTKLNAAGTALIYSTYLGGTFVDGGQAIALDASGNAYITGQTTSTDFPTTTGAFQTTLIGGATCPGGRGGCSDAFVTKLNSTGTGLVYSTYLGGGPGNDSGTSIAVDSAGNAYVTGTTNSGNFPVTPGAFQTSPRGSDDAYVAKLNPTGTALTYSTYFGGSSSDLGAGITLDSSGNAYLVGRTQSTDFPTTPGAFQTQFPVSVAPIAGFVSKLNASGTALVYSTLLGGSSIGSGSGLDNESPSAVAVDSAGYAYVTGQTNSPMFPTTLGAFQSSKPGSLTAVGFVTKLNLSGTGLVYSTYLGGSSGDSGNAITVDSAGNAYVAGQTYSNDFPTSAVTLDPDCGTGAFPCAPFNFLGGSANAFVTILSPTGSALVFSTFLGGTGTGMISNPHSAADSALGVAVDSSGNVYVTGSTNSVDFPTTPGAFQTTYQPYNLNAFIAKISPTAVGPALAVAPLSLDFGTLLFGTTSPSQTVTLTDRGNGTLTIISIAISGTNAGDFAQTSTCGSRVAAQTNCTISVTFTPTAQGMRTATLTIADNAIESPHTVALSGTAGTPAVSLSGSSLTFASQPIGTTSAAQTLTLANTGNVGLTITTIASSGDFAQTNTCGSSVAAGGYCTINVTFSPAAVGSRSGTLTITDNAPSSPQTVLLGGTGGPPVPIISLSPTGLTFASQAVGATSTAQMVTLSNNGSATLTISNIAASGDFAQTSTCGTSVANGSNCAISVTFTPTASGTRNGTLTITDNASGSPHAVALSGNGMDISVSASSTSAAITAGQPANYTLSISPLGGFNQSVSLSCSGAPPQATCSVSPTSLTPPAMATVTVTTKAHSMLVPGPSAPALRPLVKPQPDLLPLLVLPVFVILKRRWASTKRASLAFAAVIVSVLLWAGCGGGGGTNQMQGTPTGTYTLTVTAASGSLTHTIPLTLTVN